MGFMVFKLTGLDSQFQRKNRFWKMCTECLRLPVCLSLSLCIYASICTSYLFSSFLFYLRFQYESWPPFPKANWPEQSFWYIISSLLFIYVYVKWARVVSVAVRGCSGGRLVILLVANISNIIMVFSFCPQNFGHLRALGSHFWYCRQCVGAGSVLVQAVYWCRQCIGAGCVLVQAVPPLPLGWHSFYLLQ